jgi:hypothetical protein
MYVYVRAYIYVYIRTTKECMYALWVYMYLYIYGYKFVYEYGNLLAYTVYVCIGVCIYSYLDLYVIYEYTCMYLYMPMYVQACVYK